MIEIVLKSGNLLSATADAIVNPANSIGAMGGGVALAIKLAGGTVIEEAARAHGVCAVGEAFTTTAGTLPYQAVI
ncbi:MAG: hypothetical protein ACD_21C00114G0005, partial [uncultured bacterium]